MLVLGTAALGFPYGTMNKVGKMNFEYSMSLVEEAWRRGIKEFDTAQIYQDSESFLGQAFQFLQIQSKVKVVTKLDPALDYLKRDEIIRSIERSLRKLKVEKLYGVLLHREHLLSYSFILETLWEIRDKYGFMDKIGVSIYHSRYAMMAASNPVVDIIQLPSCILDRRFEKTCFFELAQVKKKEIYLRNIFLQGLLLADVEGVSMEEIKKELIKFHTLLSGTSFTPCEFIMGYLKVAFPTAKLIFGAETQDQILECSEAFHMPRLSKEMVAKVRKIFSDVPNEVLVPKLWDLQYEEKII